MHRMSITVSVCMFFLATAHNAFAQQPDFSDDTLHKFQNLELEPVLRPSEQDLEFVEEIITHVDLYAKDRNFDVDQEFVDQLRQNLLRNSALITDSEEVSELALANVERVIDAMIAISELKHLEPFFVSENYSMPLGQAQNVLVPNVGAMERSMEVVIINQTQAYADVKSAGALVRPT